MRLQACALLLVSIVLAAAVAPRDDAASFFRANRVLRLAVELSPESVEALRKDPRAYARATIKEGEKVVSANAGVKLKGAAGSFRAFDDRPGLTVDIDRFGEARAYNGLKKFHLNNAVQDPSYLSEWTASEIMRSADQPAARVTHTRLRINERDLGLYVVKESFDEDFLERNFKDPRGNLYDGGFCQDLDAPLERDEGTGLDEKADLRAIVEACRLTDMKDRWSRLEQLVDIDDFVRYIALEAMVCHWDGYCLNRNNYRIYFEPTKKARFIPHGMDQCFGDTGLSVLDAPHAMVAASVMRNPEWRKDYRKQVSRLLPKFDPKVLAKELDPVQKRIQSALKEFDPQAAAAQAAEAKAFFDRITARATNLREQSAAPEPKPPVFRRGQAVPMRTWRPASESEDAVVDELVAGRVKWYRVKCGESGRCVAGWRSSVLLAKGRYKLEALARLDGVRALDEADAPCAGAGIRTFESKCGERGVGTGDRPLEIAFEVTEDMADVELVLELRAAAGEAGFRADSIKLTRE